MSSAWKVSHEHDQVLRILSVFGDNMTNIDKLVSTHINLADYCARKWRKWDSKIPYEDYYQEACVGLVLAARRHKPDSKAKFSTYAFTTMDGAIKTMRAFWYTGYKEGFTRSYPVPTWVLLDHPPVGHDRENDDHWYTSFTGQYTHDYALRESINNYDVKVEMLCDRKRKIQNNLREYIESTKAFMKAQRISHEKLASMVGVSQPTVTRWLGGSGGLNIKARQRLDAALYN